MRRLCHGVMVFGSGFGHTVISEAVFEQRDRVLLGVARLVKFGEGKPATVADPFPLPFTMTFVRRNP